MLDIVNSLVSQAVAASGTAGNKSVIDKLTQQILATSDPNKWSGQGFGSAQANAADMAKILVDTGISDIKQFGKLEDGSFGNILTKQSVPNTYGERQTGNAFGGTYTGKGNTGYRVEFGANGQPVFYTTSASSSDVPSWVAPALALGAGAFGLPSMLGGMLAPSASAAVQAGLGGAAFGGGAAALTGNNVLKGALTGGALGYGGSTISDMLSSSGTGPGYYDEITGKFISDPNGGLQGPLTNSTSGTNLSSMSNYSYDPTSGNWTSPDGSITPTLTNTNPLTNGKDILTNAGAGVAANSLLNNSVTSALGTSLGTGLGLSALGNVLGTVANQSGISDARDLINQYGTQAQGNLAKAYSDAQGLNTANRADLASNYANTQGNLYDIYNKQVGIQQPYQAIGQAGSQGLLNNQDYLTHQFNTNDLYSNLAPNYQFQLEQGQMANQRAANMGGGALGGNAMQGLQRYTQDYAGGAYQNAFNNYNTQRNNIFNSLKGMADIGTTSAGQLANLGNTYGSNLAGLSSNYGGNLTTAAGQGINAANQYGLNTAGLATGIGSALASNATQSGANNANLLSNLGNTALLGSMLKAT